MSVQRLSLCSCFVGTCTKQRTRIENNVPVVGFSIDAVIAAVTSEPHFHAVSGSSSKCDQTWLLHANVFENHTNDHAFSKEFICCMLYDDSDEVDTNVDIDNRYRYSSREQCQRRTNRFCNQNNPHQPLQVQVQSSTMSTIQISNS